MVQPMGIPLRKLWLVVATGGWWTMDDVRAEVGDDVPADAVSISRRLNDLVIAGYLVKRAIPYERRAPRQGRGSMPSVEYAVTPECRVPYGLFAGEIASAFGAKVAA